MILPINTEILLSVTSTDVIHSFALPNFGIKVDAIPGRITSVRINSFMEGIFYGQCSELCGVKHGFMPIVVEFQDEVSFIAIMELLRMEKGYVID